ncbi:MAG: c-type cytochrome [Pseudomonadota bacterium]
MKISVVVGIAMVAFALHGGMAEAAGSNPCGTKNPCAAAKSAKPAPAMVRRPAGTHLATGDHAELLKEGEKLWHDPGLSTNGFTCDTCHNNHATFSAGFAAPYPHAVGMVKERLGIAGKIRLDEMVQFCLVMPLASKPLPWDSRDLAALTAYTAEMQRTFRPTAE